MDQGELFTKVYNNRLELIIHDSEYKHFETWLNKNISQKRKIYMNEITQEKGQLHDYGELN